MSVLANSMNLLNDSIFSAVRACQREREAWVCLRRNDTSSRISHYLSGLSRRRVWMGTVSWRRWSKLSIHAGIPSQTPP